MGGVVVQSITKSDGSQDHQGSTDEADPGLMASAEDLIKAVHAKDAKGVIDALEAAFAILDAGDGDE